MILVERLMDEKFKNFAMYLRSKKQNGTMKILEYINNHRNHRQLTIQAIQSETSMHPHDIALTFMLLGFIRKNPDNKFVLAIDWTKVEQHMAKVNSSLAGGTRVNLDPDSLRWTPFQSGASGYGSPFKNRSNLTDRDSPMKTSNGPNSSSKKKRKKKKQQSRDDDSSTSSSSSSDTDSNSDSDSDKDNDKKKLGKNSRDKRSSSGLNNTGNGSGLKRKTGSTTVTTTGSNQRNDRNANKNNKNQKPNSGESKGLAGGNITSTINTNMKNIRPGAAALSKVCFFL